MKILEQHFSVWMEQEFPFRDTFNSHQLNILRKCNSEDWLDLLPIYSLIRYTNLGVVSIKVGDIVLPLKLAQKIQSTIGAYFKLPAKNKFSGNYTCKP